MHGKAKTDASYRLSSGTSLVVRKPSFSQDSKLFFLASGTEVCVYSVETAQRVRIFRKHQANVVAVVNNPLNLAQIYSCSEDGVVIKWDPSDGAVLSQFSLLDNANLDKRWRVTFFEMRADEPVWYYAVNCEGDTTCSLYRSSQSHLDCDEPATLVADGVLLRDGAISSAKRSSLVAFIKRSDKKLPDINDVFVASETYKKPVLVVSASVSIVACHPTESCVATGGLRGKVLVWNNPTEPERCTPAVHHWHTTAVNTIAFTWEGSFMYTGGGEGAMVKWELNSNIRMFLPRLGVPIKFISVSPDNSHILVSQVDNTISVVDSQGIIRHIVHGLSTANWAGHNLLGSRMTTNSLDSNIIEPISKKAKYCRGLEILEQLERKSVGLIWEERSRCLVLNGTSGLLQFYRFDEGKQLFNLDVTLENFCTQLRTKVVLNTEVVCASFCGEWLATAEHFECPADPNISVDVRLKFWLFDDAEQTYVLNTNVFMAHSARIRACRLVMTKASGGLANSVVGVRGKRDLSHWDRLMCVTIGDDAKMRIWIIVESEVAGQVETVTKWACFYECTYRDSLVPSCLDVSEDSSLLGVGFGHVITLWQTELVSDEGDGSNKLQRHRTPIAALCQHEGDLEPVKNVVFGRNSASHVIIGAQGCRLTSWDVLRLVGLWQIDLATVYHYDDVNASVSCLLADPNSSHVIIFTNRGHMQAVRAIDGHVTTEVSMKRDDAATAACYVPRIKRNKSFPHPWQTHSVLLFLSNDCRVFNFPDDDDEEEEEEDSEEGEARRLLQVLPATPFGMLVADKVASSGSQQHSFDSTLIETEKNIADKHVDGLLTVPAHVLPTMSSLCEQFMTALLPKAEKQESKLRANEADEDGDSEEGAEEKMDEGSALPEQMIVEQEVVLPQLPDYKWLNRIQ